MNSLSKAETKQLVKLLSKLEPGLLPKEIFFALSKLVVTVTYTVVPLFYDKKIKVHLVKREADDSQWAGLLHTPGKVILPTDKSINQSYSRLRNTEMKALKIKEGPVYAGYVFDKIPRGKEIALINYVLLQSKPSYGKLYEVTKLPKNIIPTEIERIKIAVRQLKLSMKSK